jgi:hypothetical protein
MSGHLYDARFFLSAIVFITSSANIHVTKIKRFPSFFNRGIPLEFNHIQ